MPVKESLREFINDVKHKFTHKRKRDSCSTCTTDSYDGALSDSTADTLSHLDSARVSMWSASDISSPPSPPERGRFVTFARPRTQPTSSTKPYRGVLHKVRKRDGRQHVEDAADASQYVRMHTADGALRQVEESPLSIRGAADEQEMLRRAHMDYAEVLDIRARSAKTSLAEGSTKLTSRDSPQFDKESQSDTSGTLVSRSDTAKSASKSDTRSESIDFHSDKNLSVAHPMMAPAVPVPAPVPAPDLAAGLGEEEISIPSSPVVPQAPHTTTPPQPMAPTPASPAPVYIPRLTAPSMFLPIPNTDPLTAPLTKHVPAEQRPRRDIVGEYAGRDVHEMVMSNSWRALARMARDRIVASDPEDLARILDLWSLRLASLARLRLTNQASAECTNLFAVLNAVPPTSVPGSFPGSSTLPASGSHPFSPASAVSPSLSPSGLSGLAQLPGTPSQRPSMLPPSLAGVPIPATAPRHGANELAHPFELTVFYARVHYWSGDPLGYVDALSRILGKCKERAREEGQIIAQRKEMAKVVTAREGGGLVSASELERPNDDRTELKKDAEPAEESTEDTEAQEEPDDILISAEANFSMWLERIARVCLMLASQMIEMNDYQAAINLLVPLCTYRVPPSFVLTPSPALHSALARVYLLSGNLQKAEEHFSVAASAAGDGANGTDIVAMNTALLAVALGDWTRAEEALGNIVAKDPGNFTAVNNLAVALLCQGRIKEGIDLLEGALKMSPSSVVVAEPFLFNLSTLYELRSTAAIDKKRELLLEVAKWSGDGLRTSCLKMPSS